MGSQVETKEKALEATEKLLRHPDATVKDSAKVVADYLRGLPVEVDQLIQVLAPEGSAVARIDLKLSRFVASGRLYEFRRPIKVNVVWDDSYFLAFSSRFLLHGTGDTVEEALRDYMRNGTAITTGSLTKRSGWPHRYRGDSRRSSGPR